MSFFSLCVTLIIVTLFVLFTSAAVVVVAAVSGAEIVSNTSTTTNDDSSSSYTYNRELTYPEIWDVDELQLEEPNKIITLDLDWLEINPGFRDDENENENKNDANSSSSFSSSTTTTTTTSTPFVTRALGGSVPGPTIKVSPGTTVKIKFRNKLTYQPESRSSRRFDIVDIDSSTSSSSYYDLSRLNKFNDPDTANLHCHGCHISSVLPSDDTTIQVGPNTEYDYEFTFPLDHSPGMYWLHPHHHGSSTTHLVGGAALAIIVKDKEYPTTNNKDNNSDSDNISSTDSTTIRNTDTDTDTDTDTVTSVKERILIFQDWDIPEAIQVARMAGDRILEQNWIENIQNKRVGASIGQRFVTVNGMYHPIITSSSSSSPSSINSDTNTNSNSIECGKWERWRMLYAGWQDLPLNFGVQDDNNNGANCEFYLLAKDGIYITDYPRGPMMTTNNDNNNNNNLLPIPPGGRTELMVRCNRTGTTKFEALGRRNILTIQLNCDSDNDTDSDDVSNSNSTTTTIDDNDDEDDNDTQSVDETTTDDQRRNQTQIQTQTQITSTATKAVPIVEDGDESSSISSSSSIPPPFVLLVDKENENNNENNCNNVVPDYLQSVLDDDTTTVAPGCSCGTQFDGYDDTSTINDEIYRPGNRFIHTSYLGATIERKLLGMDEHSYHQHVYPFQLIDFPTASSSTDDNDNDYFKIGDWHDTYLDNNQKRSAGASGTTNTDGHVTIRYRTTTFAGKIMIHCHNTLHADRGMIQKEYVRNVTATADDADVKCVCDSFQPISGIGIIDDVEHATVLVGKEQQQGTLSTTSSSNAAAGGGGRSTYSTCSSSITTGLLLGLSVVVLILLL